MYTHHLYDCNICSSVVLSFKIIHLHIIFMFLVESPNAIFTRMRDNIDAALLIKEPCFKAEYVLKGYSDVMIHTARLKYKLSNKQARRVYEIIRYFYTKDTQDDYRKFIMDVKTHRKKQYMVRRLSNSVDDFCSSFRIYIRLFFFRWRQGRCVLMVTLPFRTMMSSVYLQKTQLHYIRIFINSSTAYV